jgi:putative ABC transport system substrate-binding protein
MERRTFLGLITGGLLAAPLAAEAQQAGKVYRIGVLWHADSREAEGPIFEAFLTGLRERGYIEGGNVVFEHRFAGETVERFASLAGELVALKPDILVGVSPPSAVALKKTGTSIPIVFTMVGDAEAVGLVQSLSRPGKTITGFTILSADLTAKRLQMLLEILPGMKAVGVLYNPDSPSAKRILREAASATRALGLAAQVAEVRIAEEIDTSFARFAKAGIKGVLVASDALLWRERKRIAHAAVAAGIAETQFSREGAEAGSLFSYGTNLPEVARHTSDYVVRILLGVPPRDLPVVEPSRFELVINLKTAKALGLTIPPSLLQQADEVIQ